METLRGIFPRSEPPPKRDFLKENVIRIKNMQRMRKPSTEYNNRYSKPIKARKLSLYENKAVGQAHSSNELSLCSRKAPIGNLRKSLSTMSISKDCGTQTVDPDGDEYFLKDTIIRYPSASTIRSIGNSHQQLAQTCSKGHLLEQEEVRPSRYKSHFHNRKDDHAEKMERHVSNLSEFLSQGSINKKPSSILKSSSLQKLNKNTLNESQQKEDRQRVGSANHRARAEKIVISDESEDESEKIDDNVNEEEPKKKESPRGKRETGGGDMTDAKKKQLKAAAEDPECPEGHVPLSEDERLESLKIAKKRFKELVDELNRLPMTCETLRVRNRKIEIEKELRSLEINIRVFSRSKVYVKLTE